jgi:cyclophilin family peptidyl-prolyl cis-trans isomerase
MATTKRQRQKAARREKVERQNREAKRHQLLRRSIISVVVVTLVLGSGYLIFKPGSSPSSTTTTMPVSTTTTTMGATTTTVNAPAVTQAQADALATSAGCPASTAIRVNNLTWSHAPAMTINRAKTYNATFVTTAGTFVVRLNAAAAPVTVNNFVFLAQHNFYHCVIFHRVIPGFMNQTGDPTGLGTGGPGYTIADENPKAGNPTYPLFSVAMANTGAPHSGGSQFFIVTGANGEGLPNSYALFGQVISGSSVVMTINNAGNASPASNGMPPVVTHRILSITISSN